MAIAITGKPFILAAGADLLRVRQDRQPRPGPGHRADRPCRLRQAAYVAGADLRLHQWGRARWWPGAHPALPLPDRLLRRLRDRSTRMLPGPSPGLGRRVLGPQPDRCRPGRAADHRESTQPEQDAEWPQAYELGLADAIFDGADFLARSLDWAGQIVAGSLTVTRPEVDRGEPGMRRWRGPAASLTARSSAPRRAVSSARADGGSKDLGPDRGVRCRGRSTRRSDHGSRMRASLYAFDLVQKRARKPAGAPDPALARPVTKVGIVGAGLMASQLALLFLRRLQVPVVITDLDQERVDKGLGSVAARSTGCWVRSGSPPMRRTGCGR